MTLVLRFAFISVLLLLYFYIFIYFWIFFFADLCLKQSNGQMGRTGIHGGVGESRVHGGQRTACGPGAASRRGEAGHPGGSPEQTARRGIAVHAHVACPAAQKAVLRLRVASNRALQVAAAQQARGVVDAAECGRHLRRVAESVVVVLDEGVLEEGSRCVAAVGFGGEAAAQEVKPHLRHVARQLRRHLLLPLPDDEHRLPVVAERLPRRGAHRQHLDHDAPGAPDVAREAVLAGDRLRGHEERCANDCAALVVCLQLFARAEVADLGAVCGGEQDVVALDVAVHDAVLVQEGKALQDVVQVRACACLREDRLPCQVAEGAAVGVLHEDVQHARRLLEPAAHAADDVVVAQLHHHVHLLHEAVARLRGGVAAHRDALDGKGRAVLLERLVHDTLRAVAELAPQLVVFRDPRKQRRRLVLDDAARLRNLVAEPARVLRELGTAAREGYCDHVFVGGLPVGRRRVVGWRGGGGCGGGGGGVEGRVRAHALIVGHVLLCRLDEALLARPHKLAHLEPLVAPPRSAPPQKDKEDDGEGEGC
eukprot:Rhum_TRINITY_DN15266_c11_g1::Rhum_TRINITY_DN15266_c11_g1_i1::g.147816::m.147816